MYMYLSGYFFISQIYSQGCNSPNELLDNSLVPLEAIKQAAKNAHT